PHVRGARGDSGFPKSGGAPPHLQDASEILQLPRPARLGIDLDCWPDDEQSHSRVSARDWSFAISIGCAQCTPIPLWNCKMTMVLWLRLTTTGETLSKPRSKRLGSHQRMISNRLS